MKTLIRLWIVALVVALVATSVRLTRAQAVYAPAYYSDLVEYAIWELNLRGGFSGYYAGPTDQQCLEKSIVIRLTSSDQWAVYENTTTTTPGAFAATCEDPFSGRIFIAFNPYYLAFNFGRPTLTLVKHELTHAFGMWGHTPGGLMDGTTIQFPYLSQKELSFLLNSTWWPKPRMPNWCTAILGPDNSLFIPEIAGYQALLTYAGVVDGRHSWRLASTSTVAGHGCTSSRFDSGHVILDDVQAPGVKYKGSLVPSNGLWQCWP